MKDLFPLFRYSSLASVACLLRTLPDFNPQPVLQSQHAKKEWTQTSQHKKKSTPRQKN